MRLINGPGGSTIGFAPLDPGAGTGVGYINGLGSYLWVSRTQTYGFMCNNAAQLTLSGAQAVTVEVLAPADVHPDRTTAVTGDTVNFTIEIPWTTNFTVGTGWQWVKDSANSPAAVPVQGCGLAKTCSFRIFGDGHATVGLIAENGAIGLAGVSQRINVAPTPLMLVADQTHVSSGSQVKFTARRGDGHPVQVESWVWTPGAGSPPGPSAIACAGGDSVCLAKLVNTTTLGSLAAQTGSMTAWAVLGTATRSATVAVTVDPDSLGIDPDSGGGCDTAQMTFARTAPKQKITTRGTPNASRSMAFSCPPGTPGLFVTPRLSVLHPRIRDLWIGTVHALEREPDTAYLEVVVMHGGDRVPNVDVTLRAEWLSNVGGHAHLATVLPFSYPSMTKADAGPENGQPISGYFLKDSTQKSAVVTLTTDATGTVYPKLVAGYLGGAAQVIVQAYVSDRLLYDTVHVTYTVPGLVKLSDYIGSNVYWIGGTDEHPQGTNFYVKASLVTALSAIANGVKDTSGAPLYAQYNDASLPNGGVFTAKPKQVPGGIDNPYKGGGHLAHAVGLDIDISVCLADAQGDGGDILHRVRGTYKSGTITCTTSKSGIPVVGRALAKSKLDSYVSQYGGISEVHADAVSGDHYHVRFP